MSRYLFVVPPLAGHVNPAIGVARELERRGHDVAWAGHEAVVGPLVGEDATVYTAGDGFLDDIEQHLAERDRVKGLAAVRFLWERFLLPLAVDMADPVRQAVDDVSPDVLVTDQQALAGGIVAAERGLVWAVSATAAAELVEPVLPKAAEWMRAKLTWLCTELGTRELAEAGFDPRYSPYLVLEYSTPALVGEVAGRPEPLAFVGPIMSPRPTPGPFPWDWLARHDTNIFVSLGTVSDRIGGQLLGTVLEAVAGQPYGVVMVGDPDSLPTPPGNVLVRSFVPQIDLLARVEAVVCHAGQNTTAEALAFGLPLVCVPIRDDQPIVAKQVVRAGAGRLVKFSRATPPGLAAAIDDVLRTPSYRAAARRVAESFAAAGGARAAADLLEALAGHPAKPPPMSG